MRGSRTSDHHAKNRSDICRRDTIGVLADKGVPAVKLEHLDKLRTVVAIDHDRVADIWHDVILKLHNDCVLAHDARRSAFGSIWSMASSVRWK